MTNSKAEQWLAQLTAPHTTERTRGANLNRLLELPNADLLAIPGLVDAFHWVISTRAAGKERSLTARSRLADMAREHPAEVARTLRPILLKAFRDSPSGGQTAANLWNTVRVLEGVRPGFLAPDIVDIAVRSVAYQPLIEARMARLLAPLLDTMPPDVAVPLLDRLAQSGQRFTTYDMGGADIWRRLARSHVVMTHPAMRAAMLEEARRSLQVAGPVVPEIATDHKALTELVFDWYPKRVTSGHDMECLLSALAGCPAVALTPEQLSPYLSSDNARIRLSAVQILGRLIPLPQRTRSTGTPSSR